MQLLPINAIFLSIWISMLLVTQSDLSPYAFHSFPFSCFLAWGNQVRLFLLRLYKFGALRKQGKWLSYFTPTRIQVCLWWTDLQKQFEVAHYIWRMQKALNEFYLNYRSLHQHIFLIAFGIKVEVLHICYCTTSTSTWDVQFYC